MKTGLLHLMKRRLVEPMRRVLDKAESEWAAIANAEPVCLELSPELAKAEHRFTRLSTLLARREQRELGRRAA